LSISGYLLVSHHHYRTHHHHSIIIIIIIIAIIAIPDPLTTRAPPRWSRTEAQPIVHEMAMKCVGSGARAKRATEGEAQGTVPLERHQCSGYNLRQLRRSAMDALWG